ncbi:hypothetical protein Barb7_01777 [Bacteroidales bacterium Barb7]|nr:hypothetical protein Barb7_02339 [Bacteroidales bacterium Barb7]OAV74690.1 hypothetical protein Barb7_01777 [Bacteroidales bacterium Barb7]
MNILTNKDVLADLFRRLPEENLPDDFRARMMQRIRLESARVKRRSERLSLTALVAASLIMIATGVAVFFYKGFPALSSTFSLSIPPLTSLPFYLYIAGLTFFLLWGDYLLRKRHEAKHGK